tara:strand:+ start:52 stop:249 length:198 start_codon:yes stop_codon:yes gene_type:complete
MSEMEKALLLKNKKIKELLGEGSKNISNKDRDTVLKMLEKARDEKKSLKGTAFANGGKVDFKGSF